MTKVTLTFETDEGMEPRPMEVPLSWLEDSLDEVRDARHATIDLFLMERQRVLKGNPTKTYDFEARDAYDKEHFPRLPPEELDAAWVKVRERLEELGCLTCFDDVKLPIELRGLLRDIMAQGPHRALAPAALCELLADMLGDTAAHEAEGPCNYDPRIFVDMLSPEKP